MVLPAAVAAAVAIAVPVVIIVNALVANARMAANKRIAIRFGPGHKKRCFRPEAGSAYFKAIKICAKASVGKNVSKTTIQMTKPCQTHPNQRCACHAPKHYHLATSWPVRVKSDKTSRTFWFVFSPNQKKIKVYFKDKKNGDDTLDKMLGL